MHREERANFIRLVLGLGFLVLIVAVCHVRHLMGVEPRHYTEYHRQLLPLHNLNLLAVQWAMVAAFGPGLAFGLVCFFLCRGGEAKPISFWSVLPFAVGLLLAVEALSLGVAAWSVAVFRETGAPLFPESLFPELTPGIVYTQSANLVLPVAACLLSVAFFAALWRRRFRSQR